MGGIARIWDAPSQVSGSIEDERLWVASFLSSVPNISTYLVLMPSPSLPLRGRSGGPAVYLDMQGRCGRMSWERCIKRKCWAMPHSRGLQQAGDQR